MEIEKPRRLIHILRSIGFHLLLVAYLILSFIPGRQSSFIPFPWVLMAYMTMLSTGLGMQSVNRKHGVVISTNRRKNDLKRILVLLVAFVILYLMIVAAQIELQSPIITFLSDILFLMIGLIIALLAVISIY